MTFAALALYGTDEEAPPARTLAAGALSVTLAPGGLGAIRWNGAEVLRAAQALVRDTDWGTWPEEDLHEDVEEHRTGFRLSRRFALAQRRISARMTIAAEVTATGGMLDLHLTLSATQAIATNRAGFVVLHPAAFSGAPLTVTGPDPAQAPIAGQFPRRISPAQPYRDITGLGWSVGPVRAELSFEGEIFEMEDQRNWSDGSFKTYCRPLSRPWPYDLAPGAPVRQTLRLQIVAEPRPAATARAATESLALGGPSGTMPAVQLAAQPDWRAPVDVALPAVQGIRLRLDLSGSSLPAPVQLVDVDDLDLILPDDADCARENLSRLAETGLASQRIAALPRAYLQSHQPDGQWPRGMTPGEALDLAAHAFPAAEPTGGVLTCFTELNRYPQAARLGRAVTFETWATVHDASDLAVMQTLEALPAIFDSAAHLAGGRPLRLGLVTIGMRSNPYGATLATNAANRRRTMTDQDPRHRAAFGAAFALGAVAATLGHPVASLCLGAVGGPFGIDRDGGLSPLGHLIAALAEEAGRPRAAVTPPAGLLAVASDRRLFLANAGATPRDAGPGAGGPLGPYEWRLIDRSSM
jgi:hypothetical protein